MAKANPATQPSADEQDDAGALAVPTEQDEQDAAISAAAGRAVALIQERGYGTNTTRLIMYIAGRAVDEADLNAVITEQLTERLLNATSADDILMPFDPTKGATLLEQPLAIQSCTFIESDFEGFPWYVSLVVTRPGRDNTEVLTVGGEKVVMQVAAAEANGLLPMFCRIHKADKATKAGYFPLDLRPIHNL